MTHCRRLLMVGLLLVVGFLFFQMWLMSKVFQRTAYFGNDGESDSMMKPVSERNDEPSSHQDLLQGIEMTGSLKLLMNAALSYEVNVTKETTEMMISSRCTQYGLNTRTQRRRVFWGSLIADDSWHVLGAAAMEYHGLLDGIVFVESNTTQSMQQRQLRFEEGSIHHRLLTNSRLWGTDQIRVEQFVVPPHNESFYRSSRQLWRENDQRNVIFGVWKEMGMNSNDIALLSDADEIASRELLLALQYCEVPEFLPGKTVYIRNGTESHSFRKLPMDRPHDCFQPKVSSFSVSFEGTPRCMQVPRRLRQPNFIIGECVQGIGDDSLRLPSRRIPQSSANQRDHQWKINSVNFVEWKNQSIPLGPLWDATDIRMMAATSRPIGGYSEVGVRPTGFHLHNFFDSITVLRNKYLTYGHPRKNALEVPLEELQPNDIGFMVDCLKDLPGKNTSKWRHPTLNDWKGIPMPIAFSKAPDYFKLRHTEFQKELAEDERHYGVG